MEGHHSEHSMAPSENSPKEIVKFGLVLAGIFLVSFWLARAYGPATAEGWVRWFMGVFFLVFSSFKFIGYKMFVMMFAGYDVVAKRLKSYAYAYPFIELALGSLYLLDLLPYTRDVLTILVMGVGTIGVVQEIKKRSGVHCACLGNVIKLPLSTVSLVEDAGMVLMAVAMLVLN